MTCDFRVGWSPSQWEAFAKKRSYKERKRSRPSGSIPPAAENSPHAQTSSEVMHPEASPSSHSLPSEGQDEVGEGDGWSWDALVLLPEGLPLLPLIFCPVRGVEVSLVARLLRTSAPLSLRLLRKLLRGGLLVRSRRPLPAPLPRWPILAHHSTLCDVVSQESLLWSSPIRDPPVFPDLWVGEQGRIAEPILGRTALAIAPVVLARLTARDQAVESVGGGGRLDLCPPANGRDVIGRVLRTTTDHVDSIRDPLLFGEVVVTVRGHAIPLAALVTARGHMCALFPPLTARDHWRVDDEPDVSDRWVWRRWLSPRLLSSLKRLLQ